MKIRSKGLYAVIVFMLICFVSCKSVPSSSLYPIPYTLMDNEMNSASINFSVGNPGVSFVYFNNVPRPEEGTFWNPVMFPGGVPLQMTVHAYYEQSTAGAYTTGAVLGGLIGVGITAATSGRRAARSVDMNVLFSCPPLEAGKEYTLSFKKERGNPGKNILILTDMTSNIIIHEQEFEMRD